MQKQAQRTWFGISDTDGNDPNSAQSAHARLLTQLRDSFYAAGTEYKNTLKQARNRTQKTSGWTKMGAVPGGPNNMEVEQASEAIAEQQIRTRVPLLMPYCIGFQMLKKTDDDTRSCGIFAFKAGEEMVYVPVFIIDGEVQGYELMYLVSRDQFVPSDEKHINYLLSRKPMEPGKVELRDRTEIAGRATLGDTGYLSGLKLSSFPKTLSREVVEDALRRVFKGASLSDVETSPRYISAMNHLAVSNLFDISSRSVKRASAWSNHYPIYDRLLHFALKGKKLHDFSEKWDKVAGFATEIGVYAKPTLTLQEYLMQGIPKTASLSFGTVDVKEMDKVPIHQFAFMPTAAVDILHKKGYYVTDTRDQTKLAALVEAKENSSIKSPDLPGVYKVFMADGAFKKCVVLRADTPYQIRDDFSSHPYHQFFVIPADGSAYMEVESAKDVVVLADDFESSWKDVLPKSDSSDTWRNDSFLITPSGYAWKSGFEEIDKETFRQYDRQVLCVPNNQSGFSLVSAGGDEHTPITCARGTFLCRYRRSDDLLGSRTLWFSRFSNATTPVRVQKRDKRSGKYSVNGLPEMSKGASVQALMQHYDLALKTAEDILQRVDHAYPQPVHCRCEKLAFSGRVPLDPMYANFPPKDYSSDSLTGMPMDVPMESEEAIMGATVERQLHPLDQWPGAADMGQVATGVPKPNANDVQIASQAAQLGQREFVSAQMLMSLLREVDDDRVISRYIVIFEKACDALGRLYMQILWRVDAFKERFGETQYKEFKEMLVALFQSTGDFIAYLRQRDIRPAPVLSLGTVDSSTTFAED
jgi:hypothetical protein